VCALFVVMAQTVAGEPPKQLKGFTKLAVAAGATATATFALDDRTVSIWDVTTHAWTVVKGEYGVMLGSSSMDLRLNGTLTV
jgi:beta-glucosidase